MPNDLRPTILGDWKILVKSENFIKLLPGSLSLPRNENFVSISKKILKSAPFHMKTTVCLKFLLNDWWVVRQRKLCASLGDTSNVPEWVSWLIC